MIRVENIDVYGFEAAIRGMRNPLNSWARSDSSSEDGIYKIGQNDLDLMRRLFKGGTEHRKYLRMINVTMDIIAPLYWWKEFDTYKVGTVCNSCSTMHKIHAKEFTLDDFSCEYCPSFINGVVDTLEAWRKLYLKTKDKKYWYAMIQLLPTSYNQRRTVQFNYETVFNIIRQREHHKLNEWVQFVEFLKELPYVADINE